MNVCGISQVLHFSVGQQMRVLCCSLTVHHTRNVSASTVRRDEYCTHCRTLSTACVSLPWALHQALYPQQTTRSLSTAVVGYKYFSKDDAKQEDSEPHAASFMNSTSPLTNDERLLMVKTEYALWKEEEHEHIPTLATDGHEDVSTLVSEGQWQYLAKLDTAESRKEHFSQFFINEMKRRDYRKRREERRILDIERTIKINEMDNSANQAMQYGFLFNTLFSKFTTSEIRLSQNKRLINAKQFGQPLIFDFSYDCTEYEKHRLVHQIKHGHTLNRSHSDPYYMHFCNFDPQREFSQKLSSAIPLLLKEHHPIDLHKCSYLDVFPRDRLVYLSTHCQQELDGYDNNDIYIIGVLFDQDTKNSPSVAKAKREGIRIRRLPLEKYVDLRRNVNSLALNQVVGILLELKHSGSWVQALESIPRSDYYRRDDAAGAVIDEDHRRNKDRVATMFNVYRRLR